jgi:hypothetical protein
MTPSELVAVFASFFPPNPVKHGTVAGVDANGKKRAFSHDNAPVTVERLKAHLMGEGPMLGYLPGTRTGTCVAAIDLDAKDYPAGDIEDAVKAVLAVCRQVDLPAYRERSQSGKGSHIWLFANREQPYGVMRAALKALVARAGIKTSTEVFPKGDKVSSNWIITPYYGALGAAGGPGKTFLRDDEDTPIACYEFEQKIRRGSAEQFQALASTGAAGKPTRSERVATSRGKDKGSVPASGGPSSLVQSLLAVAVQQAPAQRHAAAAAFLNLGQRMGALEEVAAGLKGEEVYACWFADASRTLSEWSDEVDRWVQHVRAKQGAGRGMPYLLECGFNLPDELRHAVPPAESEAERDERTPLSTRLLEYVMAERAEVWHDPAKTAYITLKVRGHWEHHAIKSTGFTDYLFTLLHEREGRALSAAVKGDVVALLQARAVRQGPCYPTAVRVGHEAATKRTFIDLGNPSWDVLEVSRLGWTIIPAERCPLRFTRSGSLQPLPLPMPGGNLADLRQFISTDDRGFIMVVAWLLGAISGIPPYPLLALSGEQGAGKSTTAVMLRSLIDPSRTARRYMPRDAQEVFLAARFTYILSYDNLSALPIWLSETLCLLSTGGAYTKRALFSDGDEVVFEAQRPVLLNGIPDLLARPDLAERALTVSLLRIAPSERRSEAQFWEDFEAARPQLFGALLDLLVVALGRLPDIAMKELPRMADFARLVVAAESQAPWPAPSFLKEYNAMLNDSAGVVLEGDLTADALKALLDDVQAWRGTVGALLTEITARQSEDFGARPPQDWPRNAKKLGANLRRLAPALEQVGYSVRSQGRTNLGEMYALSKKL